MAFLETLSIALKAILSSSLCKRGNWDRGWKYLARVTCTVTSKAACRVLTVLVQSPSLGSRAPLWPAGMDADRWHCPFPSRCCQVTEASRSLCSGWEKHRTLWEELGVHLNNERFPHWKWSPSFSVNQAPNVLYFLPMLVCPEHLHFPEQGGGSSALQTRSCVSPGTRDPLCLDAWCLRAPGERL